MKKKKFPVKSTLLLSASALLLIGSTVGSTRAALNYYSENYTAQMNMANIGVTLLENGEAVSYRNYDSNGVWNEPSEEGALLKNILGENEKFVPGKEYKEEIAVENTGSIDTFNRVILTRTWKDADGNVDHTISPELIDLNIVDGSGWVVAEDQSTPERMVLYYTQAIPAGGASPAFSDTLRIDNKIAEKVTQQIDGNTITYVYDYDGYSINLEAEVDAVQTHNAEEAIKSAWGIDVVADETSMSLQ